MQLHHLTDADKGSATRSEKHGREPSLSRRILRTLTLLAIASAAMLGVHEKALAQNPEWTFTVTDSNGNPTSRITEGEGPITVTATITNGVTFPDQQSALITWGGDFISSESLLLGDDGLTAILIPPGASSASLKINVADDNLYAPTETRALEIHAPPVGGTNLGNLTYVDNEEPPTLKISVSPIRLIEGAGVTVSGRLSHGYTQDQSIFIAEVDDPHFALSAGGIEGTNWRANFTAGETTTDSVGSEAFSFNDTSAGNGSEVVFTPTPNPDLYTLRNVKPFKVTILDNDGWPGPPRTMNAVPGDASMLITWQVPETLVTITEYQTRYRASGGGWTSYSVVQGSGQDTARAHITGLTNGTRYDFEVRARNGNANRFGNSKRVSGTPRGPRITISNTSITEGESTTITITPEGAPFSLPKSFQVFVARRGGVVPTTGGDPDFEIEVRGETEEQSNRQFNAPSNVPALTGRQSEYAPIILVGSPNLVLTLTGRDDEVAECREELFVFAYTTEGRIASSGTALNSFFIEESDTRAVLESYSINGSTVTLTFDRAISRISPPGPGETLYEANASPPEHYFSLFTGGHESASPVWGGDGGAQSRVAWRTGFIPNAGHTGTGFTLSGRTATITFDETVEQGENAWIAYQTTSRWAPLGAPRTGACGQRVGKFIAHLTNVTGPTSTTPELPVITIADADGTEGSNASVDFPVTLSPASTDTVTVDYYTVNETAIAGSDYTATTGTLTFAPGETGKTVAVPIIDDTVEDDGEAFYLVFHNPNGATIAGGPQGGTSGIAGGIIHNTEDEPVGSGNTLTASFVSMPSEHAGPGERFTFELAFSESPKAGYRKIRDDAFNVSGGYIRRAQRLQQGTNIGWRITVEPSGWGNVSLSLPGGRACTSTGAICTSDNEMLSNSPSATVQGPAALSVADASAHENTDDALDFAVTLDRASTLTVTVDYATSNGTATAGSDYTSTSGTLTFEPGDTAKTVSVPILDDAIDDGNETMTLTLSNEANARIADGTATGTINNSDPLQQAWIARFGRTVASEVVDGITDRLESKRSGSEVRIAGITLERNGAAWAEKPMSDGEERLDALEGEQTMSAHDLLMRSAFRLQGEHDGTGGPAWTAWGRFSSASFDGDTDGVKLSGDVTTGLLGADVGTDEWIAGIALSAAKGDGPFSLTSAMTSNRNSGTVDSSLTSFHPYAQIELTDRVAVWGIGGYGTGTMTIAEDGGTPIKTDIDMTMAAAGVRGDVLKASAGDAFDLALKTDALWLRTTSGATPEMVAAEADVTRLRLIVDASCSFETGGSGTLTPSIEAGLRRDAGDAEEGTGFEVGAGLRYQGDGITIEGTIRKLVAHDDTGYEEWGASGAIRIDPGTAGRGLSLTIAPTWGNAASEAEQLWSAGNAEGLVRDDDFKAESRLDAELGYRVGAPHGLGVITPYTALTLSDGNNRTWRAGARWKVSDTTGLSLEGAREERGGDETPSDALMLRASVRF